MVSIDLEKAKIIAIDRLNDLSKKEYSERYANESIGIIGGVDPSGGNFQSVIRVGRSSILKATSTDEMQAIIEKTIKDSKRSPLS